MKHLVLIAILLAAFTDPLYADERFTLLKNAPVHAAPDSGSKRLGVLKKGRGVTVQEKRGAYYRVKTRSGKALWIHERYLRNPDYDAAADVAGESPRRSDADSGFDRWRYDFSAAFGSNAAGEFYELSGGLEYFFIRQLSWRNAPFYRIQSGNNSYGLDTTIRGNLTIEGPPRIAFMVGAGGRFTSEALHVPVAEVGLRTSIGGSNIGGSVKVLMHELVRDGVANEVVLSLNISGGGSF